MRASLISAAEAIAAHGEPDIVFLDGSWTFPAVVPVN